MKDNTGIYSSIELDAISSTLLNEVPGHTALFNKEGIVVAYNQAWQSFTLKASKNRTHPQLGDNILQFLQAPLVDRNDYALRLIVGIKEVLNGETDTFKTHIQVPYETTLAGYDVTVKDIHGTDCILFIYKELSGIKGSEKSRVTDSQYKLQFHNTLDGCIIGRPNGHILEANPAACAILGYSKEELVGQHRDLIFDARDEKNKLALKTRAATGKVFGESYLIHKKGHQIPIEISSVVFEDEDGLEKTIVNFRDISTRKAIKQQLIHEKEFTDSAISSLPNAFFVFDQAGKMIRWNNVLEEELGYLPCEVEQMNVMEFIHPDDRIILQEVLQSEFHGKTQTYEIRCVSKSGTFLHYLISGSSFKKKGEWFIVGCALNRNQIIEIEREKNRSAELLNQLFDNAPIGIVLIDQDGKVNSANKSFENIFGFDSCELQGKTLDHVIVPHYMDEQAHSFTEQTFNGESFHTETIRLTKDGKEIPVLLGGVPVKVDGKVIAVYGIYVDISERKKLEQQVVELLRNEQTALHHLQDMFEEVPSAIAMLEGEDHVYSFANTTYKNLIGRDNVEGQPVEQVFPELKEQGLVEILNQCYQKDQARYFTEKPVNIVKNGNSEGELHYLNFAYKPVHDRDGKVYGILVQSIDVTEQVEARNLIERSLAEKEVLLNEVHHRVKNNLAIISGLLELEISDNENDEITRHLHSTQSRIYTIAAIHELLYENENLSHVQFDEYIRNIITKNNILPGCSVHSLISDFNMDPISLNVNQAIPLGMLLNEIFSSLNDEREEEEAYLRFNMMCKESSIQIQIEDSQHQGFKLQKQFEDLDMNLSIHLIKVLLQQIEGEISFQENGTHAINIEFDKQDIRGPYSALEEH